jgi:hypothetical protein
MGRINKILPGGAVEILMGMEMSENIFIGHIREINKEPRLSVSKLLILDNNRGFQFGKFQLAGVVT